MGDADACVNARVDAEGGEDLGRGRHACLEDGGGETVEGEGGVAAEVTVEAARDPPEAGAQKESGEKEGEAEKKEDVRKLVAELPGAESAFGLDDAIFGTAEVVEAALEEEVQGEREAGEAVGEDAVVDVAAGGEVAGEGGRPLPYFAAAAGILVVAVGEGLAGSEPEALGEKEGEQNSGDALRPIEAEAAEAGEPVGHCA